MHRRPRWSGDIVGSRRSAFGKMEEGRSGTRSERRTLRKENGARSSYFSRKCQDHFDPYGFFYFRTAFRARGCQPRRKSLPIFFPGAIRWPCEKRIAGSRPGLGRVVVVDMTMWSQPPDAVGACRPAKRCPPYTHPDRGRAGLGKKIVRDAGHAIPGPVGTKTPEAPISGILASSGADSARSGVDGAAPLLNVFLVTCPRKETAVRQMTIMRASMTPYSTAVGPSSSFKNDTNTTDSGGRSGGRLLQKLVGNGTGIRISNTGRHSTDPSRQYVSA